MLRQSVGATVVAIASVVVVPYAVALLSNILYGWPLGPHRYRRAFDPRKVFALNYALLQQLARVRYLGLAVRWKRFYQQASKDRLIRDLEYGSNGNFLDVYFPVHKTSSLLGSSAVCMPKSIVIFVYGGTWGSGDKNMYGLLCSQLADQLNAVVLCPNYSIYPKGFVDDMVQDVSDAIAYAHKFAIDFGADKDNIILIGHSAGAHLVVMTVVELSMKMLSENLHLLVDETSSDIVERSDTLEVSVINPSSIPLEIHERHFNGDSNGRAKSAPGTSTMTSSAFCVIDDVDELDHAVAPPDSMKPGEPAVPTGTVSESFIVVDDRITSAVVPGSTPGSAGDTGSTEQSEVEAEVNEHTVENISEAAKDKSQTIDADVKSSLLHDVKVTDVAATTTEVRDEPAEDLLSSIKLVIGLAGVYDIAAHYIHEMFRGVEDISTMARAMYGPKRFDRFSPTVIVQSLPKNAKLPPIHLIHGGADYTVPVAASTAFGDTVWKRGLSPVTATIINGCGHVDICLDLMEPDRYWHDIVFRDIISVVNRHAKAATAPLS